MESSDLLSCLDEQQKQVAQHLRGPLCVRAGAGTGKTRAITYRIAYGVRTGVYEPTNVLALTFTRKAADEMRERLRLLGVEGVQANTFHAAALKQLKHFWPLAIGGHIPPIIESKKSLITEAASLLDLPSDKAFVSAYEQEIEWAKISLFTPEEYVKRAEEHDRNVFDIPHARIALLMEKYEKLKTQYRRLDFEDVLLLLIGVFLERPDILSTVQRQYRYFVVDEYQDVSPLQHRLLRIWVGQRNDICVVGDAAQTIYSFTGARSDYLLNFHREFPSTRIIELVKDYRSTPEIVECANDLISKGKTEGFVTLVSQKDLCKPVLYSNYANEDEEVEEITKKIAVLLSQGEKPEDIAVLYRINTKASLYETSLSHYDIPCVIAENTSFFTLPEIREAMVYMRSMVSLESENSLQSTVDMILHQIGWRPEGPELSGKKRKRWEALFLLHNLAGEAEEKGYTMGDFVGELDHRQKTGNEPRQKAVTLSTIHNSKGLEWKHVFIVGVSEGLLPISYAQDEEAIEEERRLFYVAITRAKETLHISYSGIEHNSSSSRRGKASRFLADIYRDPSDVKKQRRKNKVQNAYEIMSPETRDFYEYLLLWRSKIAAQYRLPEHKVFYDSVLVDIALSRPNSMHELLKIPRLGKKRVEQWGFMVIQAISSYEKTQKKGKRS
ncbi:MAG: ATP-dependent DNA helicase UvrD2 [Actinomycetaceae bacterium]|nr:ATP-dependent DNA helicase UvrD2 [Actinomycetaceae bacterium]